MINLESAQNILYQTISLKLRHKHYERIVAVSDFAERVVTGEGQDELVVRYKERESKAQKDQRVRITNTLTRYTANQVRNYYRKVGRVDNVVNEVLHDSEAAREEIENILSRFYGGKSAWQYILQKAELFSFIDPNAMLIIERRDERGARGEILSTQVYPFEVRSRDVINWGTDNGVLDWVIIKQERIEVKTQEIGTGYHEEKHPVTDYYMYFPGYVIKLAQYVNVRPDELQPNERELQITEGKTGKVLYFIEGTYQNGTTEIPVIPFGAYLDDKTTGMTRVSPLDPAEEVLRDLINIKSEADLTRALHTFLQKIAYAPKCNFEDQEEGYCHNGVLSNSERDCPQCGGTGVQVHTTTQDVILIALPDDKETFFPLQDFVHYINLPEWLPKWQHEELLEKAIKRVSLAVFNTEIFQAPQLATTATEAVIEYDKIYDTITPFAQHLSEIFEKVARVTAQYIERSEGFSVRHAFPKDFKMKSDTELIIDYKAGKEAGVGVSVLTAIENDLISKKYVNDPVTVAEIQSQRKFKPFSDKSEEMISFILSARSTEDYDRVLFENFSSIMRDISSETERQFHLYPFERQREIVAAKVEQYREMIQYNNAPSSIPIFGDTADEEE
jgi:hypothetical protein